MYLATGTGRHINADEGVNGGRSRGRTARSLRATLLGALLASTAPVYAAGATVEVLYGFDDEGALDGRAPMSLLVEHEGYLYGTTSEGGDDDCGTVFRVTPEGEFERLHSMLRGTDGCNIPAGLALGADGALYGVARLFGPENLGTVFRVGTDGGFTLVHSFDLEDGADPMGGLVAAADGNLYGTTNSGGIIPPDQPSTRGTVFRVTGAGTVETVYSLQPADSGLRPAATLIEGPDGALYGTTEFGGDGCGTCGTLFRITTGGAYQTLHRFTSDGEIPQGPLAVGADGLLYGVTGLGGAHGQGMVFRIAPDGDDFEVVHSFDVFADGISVPAGGLTRGDAGHLYGTTGRGVFRIADGAVTTLVTLAAMQQATPSLSSLNGVIQGTDGRLYGTALFGGEHDCGTLVPDLTVPCGAVFRVTLDGATGNTGGGGGNGGGDTNTAGSGSQGGGGGGALAPGALSILAGLTALLGLRRRSHGDVR